MYPTDVRKGGSGHYYISEYGMGAERVHVFDAERAFARQWGKHGESEGEFNRAMAIELATGSDAASERVYVCDTANHRVQWFTTDGEWQGVIGGAGSGQGQLRFPYDVALAPDGSILACEYGGNRVSRFGPDGEYVGAFGEAGRRVGEFNGPRGIAVSESGMVFVADTDNHRIQRLTLEDLA